MESLSQKFRQEELVPIKDMDELWTKALTFVYSYRKSNPIRTKTTWETIMVVY